jgi:hypothetical protein
MTATPDLDGAAKVLSIHHAENEINHNLVVTTKLLVVLVGATKLFGLRRSVSPVKKCFTTLR